MVPGNVVGAHGSWTVSDAQISASNIQISGYPQPLPSTVATNILVPSLVTSTKGAGFAYVDSANATRILHLVDETGGQSGAPFLQNVSGSLYVTGIVKGGYDANRNHGRRFDGTVYSFFKSYTSY